MLKNFVSNSLIHFRALTGSRERKYCLWYAKRWRPQCYSGASIITIQPETYPTSSPLRARSPSQSLPLRTFQQPRRLSNLGIRPLAKSKPYHQKSYIYTLNPCTPDSSRSLLMKSYILFHILACSMIVTRLALLPTTYQRLFHMILRRIIYYFASSDSVLKSWPTKPNVDTHQWSTKNTLELRFGPDFLLSSRLMRSELVLANTSFVTDLCAPSITKTCSTL